MHYKVINHLIEQTLDELPLHRLPGLPGKIAVALTLYAETGFYADEEILPKRHGMMHMTRDDLQDLLQGYLRPRDSLHKVVKDFTLVDVREDPFESVVKACEYNLAFQILMVYFWYEYRHGQGPESIEEAIYVYQEHWNGVNAYKDLKYLQGLVAEYTQEVHA